MVVVCHVLLRLAGSSCDVRGWGYICNSEYHSGSVGCYSVIRVCLAGTMIGSLGVCVYICGCHCAHEGVSERLGQCP